MIGKNLTGKRFGKLTVTSRNASVRSANGRSYPTWDCACDCGGQRIAVKGFHLLRNSTVSCGCLKPVIDEVGNRYWKLLVTSRAENSESTGARWNCVCDCGKPFMALGYSLRKGETTNCGCSRVIIPQVIIDETGKRYGRFEVISRSHIVTSERGATWLCRCDCGTETVVLGKILRLGHKRSCGCLKKESEAKNLSNRGRTPVNYTGRRYGRLVVQSRYESPKASHKPVKWVCLCDCGKTAVVQSKRLTDIASCGCAKREMIARGKIKARVARTTAKAVSRAKIKDPWSGRHRYGGMTIDGYDDTTPAYEDANDLPDW